MSELLPLRLRAFVEPPPATDLSSVVLEASSLPRRAVIVHVVGDDHERLRLAGVRETVDTTTVVEALVVGDGIEPALADRVRGLASDQRGASATGQVGTLEVWDAGQLGRLIDKRCRIHRRPLVAWDLPWTLGRLAAHVGRSGLDGFSIALAGCGWHHHATGRWLDSCHRGRVILTPRGAGLPGAFLSWGGARDRADRPKVRRPPAFVDLAVLCAAVCGGDLDGPSSAAALLGVAWPESTGDMVVDLRAETAALVDLYRAAVAALGELAPGLHPCRAWSTGSIAAYQLRAAGVLPLATKASALAPEVKGAGAAAFLGGRTEARLVGVALPLGLRDFSGAFAAVGSTLDLTAFLRADRIDAEPVDPGDLASWLADPALGSRLYERSAWRRWGSVFAVVEPCGELSLSVVPTWPGGHAVGTFAPIDLHGARLPVSALELASGVISGGQVPNIVAAWRIVPVGEQGGLGTFRLPSGAVLDLNDPSADLPAALLLDRRAIREAALADYERARLDRVAKLTAQAVSYGLLARVDRKASRTAVESVGIGPGGEAVSTTTRHPESAGPFGFLPLAAAVTAGCRLLLAMAAAALAPVPVAHLATDSLAFPLTADGRLLACPGGDQRLPDGDEAVASASIAKAEGVFSRFDALLAPWGGASSKWEAGTGDGATVGVVFGTNRLVLGRIGDDGRVTITRSSDSDLGGHFLDPSGSGDHDADGRSCWAATLEAHLLASALAASVERPLRVPAALPDWAGRLALRPGRASSWSALVALRKAVGDPSVGPCARFVRAATGSRVGAGPVALGRPADPAAWRGLAWRERGELCRLSVDDGTGAGVIVGGTAGIEVRVRTIADHLRAWLRAADPTSDGPTRGLRKPVSVSSRPGFLRVVGRAGEALAAAATDPDPTLTYGAADGEALRSALRVLDAAVVAEAAGVATRTVRRWRSGARAPSASTLRRLASVADAGAARQCKGGCGAVVTGQRLWCSARCKKAVQRAANRATTAPALVGEAEDWHPPLVAVAADRVWFERDPDWTAGQDPKWWRGHDPDPDAPWSGLRDWDDEDYG